MAQKNVDKKILLMHLKEFKHVLDQHHVEFWLDKGTLLGAVREGKIIEWDHDVDLACWITNVMGKIPSIAQDLYDKGFDVFISNTKIKIVKKDIQLSLWLYTKKKGHAVRETYRHVNHLIIGDFLAYILIAGLTTIGSDRIHNKTVKQRLIQVCKNFLMTVKPIFKPFLVRLIAEFAGYIHCLDYFTYEIPIRYIGSLKKITFYDMELNIPQQSEEFLTFMYGDWKKPDKTWSSASHSKRQKQLHG